MTHHENTPVRLLNRRAFQCIYLATHGRQYKQQYANTA